MKVRNQEGEKVSLQTLSFANGARIKVQFQACALTWLLHFSSHISSRKMAKITSVYMKQRSVFKYLQMWLYIYLPSVLILCILCFILQ